MTTEAKPRRTGIGWAWEFQDINGDWVICNWAVPFKIMLEQDQDSAPGMDDQRPIRVEMVPTSKRNRQRYGIK